MMDDRQTQITQGAGLEESRLNTEFVDWLKKWGSPILLVIALIALGGVMYKNYKIGLKDKADQAVLEMSNAMRSGSPSALADVAKMHSGNTGVFLNASLAAATSHYGLAQRGIKPGLTGAETFELNGTIKPEAALSEDERTQHVAEAKRLFQAALDRAKGAGPAHALALSGALTGLAAIAEDEGRAADAKGFYEQAAQAMANGGFPERAKMFTGLAGSVDASITPVQLYALDSLAMKPVVLEQNDNVTAGEAELRRVIEGVDDTGPAVDAGAVPTGAIEMTPEEVEALINSGVMPGDAAPEPETPADDDVSAEPTPE